MGLEHIWSEGTGQYRFKNPAQYIPILSGFIKTTQMLTVQYCLEKEEESKVKSLSGTARAATYTVLDSRHSNSNGLGITLEIVR